MLSNVLGFTVAMGACLYLAGLSVPAHAASDGQIGATSAGVIGLSVSISKSVSLERDASVLGITGGTAAYETCVAGRGVDAVTLMAEGSGANGAFELSAAGGAKLVYAPSIGDELAPLAAGLPSPQIGLPAAGSCRNLRVRVDVAGKPAPADDAGYAGVLTLIVVPE